ncbi:hypothetical protein NDU88_003666 [Pleurodeles waltl]|uniref:Uncharacterized protein n=1 Tax=Pleurodeles waltl TaxID=8319 RepID=A0AAV7SGJ8_PLEWA|nr:hypothetical protein NDU88_003666 [Pleurodeles waltl]
MQGQDGGCLLTELTIPPLILQQPSRRVWARHHDCCIGTAWSAGDGIGLYVLSATPGAGPRGVGRLLESSEWASISGPCQRAQCFSPLGGQLCLEQLNMGHQQTPHLATRELQDSLRPRVHLSVFDFLPVLLLALLCVDDPCFDLRFRISGYGYAWLIPASLWCFCLRSWGKFFKSTVR